MRFEIMKTDRIQYSKIIKVGRLRERLVRDRVGDGLHGAPRRYIYIYIYNITITIIIIHTHIHLYKMYTYTHM